MATEVLGILDPPVLPTEKPFVDFDFTNLFKTGVTISGVPTVTCVGANDASDQTACIMNAVVKVGMVASQQFQNFAAGSDYLLDCHAIGSDGAQMDIQLIIQCRSRRLG